MTTKDEAMKLALEALEANRRTHYYCEDTWYSCPKHEDGCANEAEGDDCNCGADSANAEIEKAITAIREALNAPLAEQPAQPQEPLFKPLIDLHPGLAEELKAMDAPAQQEPAFYRHEDGHLMTPGRARFLGFDLNELQPLYTSPLAQQQEHVACIRIMFDYCDDNDACEKAAELIRARGNT